MINAIFVVGAQPAHITASCPQPSVFFFAFMMELEAKKDRRAAKVGWLSALLLACFENCWLSCLKGNPHCHSAVVLSFDLNPWGPFGVFLI